MKDQVKNMYCSIPAHWLRRTILLLIILIIGLLATACSGGDSPEAARDEQVETPLVEPTSVDGFVIVAPHYEGESLAPPLYTQEGRASVAPLLDSTGAEVTDTDLSQLALEVFMPTLSDEQTPDERDYLRLPDTYIENIEVMLVGPQQTVPLNVLPEESSLDVSRSHLGTIIEGSLGGDMSYDDGTTATFLMGTVVVVEEEAGYFSPIINDYKDTIGFGIPFRNLELTQELLSPLSPTPTM